MRIREKIGTWATTTCLTLALVNLASGQSVTHEAPNDFGEMLELSQLIDSVKHLSIADQRFVAERIQQHFSAYSIAQFTEALDQRMECINTARTLNWASSILANSDPRTPCELCIDLLDFALQSTERCKRTKDNKRLTETIERNQAFMYAHAGEPERAIQMQLHFLDNHTLDREQELTLLNNLALSYGIAEMKAEWLDTRERAFEYSIDRQLGDSHIFEQGINLAAAYYRQNELPLLLNLTETLKADFPDRYTKEERILLLELGILFNRGEYTKAQTICQSAVSSNWSTTSKYSLSIFSRQLHLKAGYPDSALQSIDDCIALLEPIVFQPIATESEAEDWLFGAYEDALHICERTGQLKHWFDKYFIPFQLLQLGSRIPPERFKFPAALTLFSIQPEGQYALLTEDEEQLLASLKQSIDTSEFASQAEADFADQTALHVVFATKGDSLLGIDQFSSAELHSFVAKQKVLIESQDSDIRAQLLTQLLPSTYPFIQLADSVYLKMEDVMNQVAFQAWHPEKKVVRTHFQTTPVSSSQAIGTPIICGAPINELPKLPNSVAECNSIADVMDAQYAPQLLLGKDANWKEVLKAVHNAEACFLHFSCHGDVMNLSEFNVSLRQFANVALSSGYEFNSMYELLPDLTWIELSPFEEYSGSVRGGTISKTNLENVSFTFLNCCSTGSAACDTQYGSYTMADAFHDAGVKYCILNTAPVPDEIAARFADVFYVHLNYEQDVESAFYQTWNDLLISGANPSDIKGYTLSTSISLK